MTAAEEDGAFAVVVAPESRRSSHDELLDLLARAEEELASSSLKQQQYNHHREKNRRGEFESQSKSTTDNGYNNNITTPLKCHGGTERDIPPSSSLSPSLSFQTPQNLSQLRTRTRLSPPLLLVPGGGNTNISPRSSNGSKVSPFFSSLSSPEREVCAICMCKLDDVESPKVSREDLTGLGTTKDDSTDGDKENKTTTTTTATKEERDVHFTVHAQISQKMFRGLSRERFFAVSDVQGGFAWRFNAGLREADESEEARGGSGRSEKSVRGSKESSCERGGESSGVEETDGCRGV